MKRRSLTVVIVLATVCTLLLAYCSFTPPILYGVHCETENHCEAGSAQFTKNLLARYPIGSDQSVMERELIREKFRRYNPTLTRCEKKGEIVVGLTISCPDWDQNWNPQHDLWYWNCITPICVEYARVIWSADAGGRITHINAGYNMTSGLP